MESCIIQYLIYNEDEQFSANFEHLKKTRFQSYTTQKGVAIKKIFELSWKSQRMFLGMVDDDIKNEKWSQTST